MIRMEVPSDAAGRWALELLVDLARLLPVSDRAADVVVLSVDDDSRTSASGAFGQFAVGDGTVRISRSLVEYLVRVAGAGEEQASDARDRHERVPSSVNPLVASGRERKPVIHDAAVTLRTSVVAAAGRRAVRLVAPWPGGHRWAATLTHDLDVVSRWPLFTGLRMLELARKGEFAQAGRVAGAAAARVFGSPVWRGAREVLDLEAAPIKATWFVLCGTPSLGTFVRGDLTYLPESKAARRVVEAATAAGHEVGLHGSFATFTDATVFTEQRTRLAAITGRSVDGVRQHFLRMRPGRTHVAMRLAGFRYDASFGFPDRNGFRLGVADVVPAWDAAAARAIPDFDLVPLVWMDRALSKYKRIEKPSAWVEDALELAGEVRAVEGLWTGLWHPNLTAPLGYPGAPDEWARLVRALVADGAWIASASEVVDWRRRRRAAVATRVTSDGRVELGQGAEGVVVEAAS